MKLYVQRVTRTTVHNVYYQAKNRQDADWRLRDHDPLIEVQDGIITEKIVEAIRETTNGEMVLVETLLTNQGKHTSPFERAKEIPVNDGGVP